jgi:hypothetical protein
VRSVDTEEGFAYVYGLADDDGNEFPEDEIIIGLYRRGLNCDADGEAKMTVAQAEQLLACASGRHRIHSASRRSDRSMTTSEEKAWEG